MKIGHYCWHCSNMYSTIDSNADDKVLFCSRECELLEALAAESERAENTDWETYYGYE